MANASGGSCFRNTALIVLGTVLGAAVAGAAFLYDWQGRPRYMARISFQILPPPVQFGEALPESRLMTEGEMLQILHRQVAIFDQDAFLDEVLKSEDFRPADPANPNTPQETQWLKEHHNDPVTALRRDLVLVPRPNAASFDLTMTASEPAEAARLLQGAMKTYTRFLEEQSSKLKSITRGDMEKAMKEAENSFVFKSNMVEDFAKQKGIDVLRSRFEVEKNRLQSLNEDYMKYDAMAQVAKEQYEAIDVRRRQDQTVKLSAEFEQQVNNDPTLRSLQLSRLTWEQEMAGENSKSTPNPAHTREIQAREEEIDRQVAFLRKKLVDDATSRMIDTARQGAVDKIYLAQYVSDKRTEEEIIVRALGQDLMSYQQKVDDLREQQALLNKMRSQMALEQANRYTDDTRVQQIVDKPAVPELPVVPKWYWYFPFGAAGGLVVSGLGVMGLNARRRGKGHATA